MANQWAVALWAGVLTLVCGLAAAPAAALSLTLAFLPETLTVLDAARGLVGDAADAAAASFIATLVLAPAATWAALALRQGWLAWIGFVALVAHSAALVAMVVVPPAL